MDIGPNELIRLDGETIDMNPRLFITNANVMEDSINKNILCASDCKGVFF